jgi:AcrR family transcriptional regulator
VTDERPTKSERTRQRILDAAAKVFRAQGYSNARLSDIAELAGMQTGSLYYHFDSREDLVAEILRLGIETAWEQVRTAVDALPATATPLDRLAVAIRAHTLAVLEISDYSSAQARIVGQVPPEVLQGHLHDQRRYGAYWNGLIEAAIDSGELRDDLDPFVARMLVLGALNWTAEWYRPGRGANAEAVADQAVSMVLRGAAVSGAEALARSQKRN